jgi:NADH-quinone oxidoreductase subunit N
MNADISPAFQLIVIISMASMTVGNIMALRQVNVKRILAFSGISHAGLC